MKDRRDFDRTLSSISDLLDQDFTQKVGRTYNDDINTTLSNLRRIIDEESDSNITYFIKNEVKSIDALSKKFSKYTKMLTKEEHTYFRDNLRTIVFKLIDNSHRHYKTL